MCRTVISQKSCIPSSIGLWNNTDTDVRNASSLSAFRSRLINEFKVSCVPPIYLEGNRYLSVLTRNFRNNCSDLNYDLFRNNLRENPFCKCNSIDYENSEHYFFCCSRNELNQDDNATIFKAVQTFIKESKRFHMF